MANMLEDGMTSMMESLLANAGTDCIYQRDYDSSMFAMHKRPQSPIMVDNGDGMLVEMLITDFLANPALLPFGEPQRGDTIQVGCEEYSVRSGPSDKVYRQMSDSMIRIHTKRVK